MRYVEFGGEVQHGRTPLVDHLRRIAPALF